MQDFVNVTYLALPTFRKMKKFIYSNPDCDYQRFVNAVQLKHSYVSNKDVVTKANKLWKELKNDKSKVFFNFACFMDVNKDTCLELIKETILKTRKIISYSHEALRTDEY